MKITTHKRPRLGYFASHTARALDYERELHHNKVMECITVKRENQALRDTIVKQRIALDALNSAHSEDMADAVAILRDLRVRLSEVTAERDRYRDALRRVFPSGAAT